MNRMAKIAGALAIVASMTGTAQAQTFTFLSSVGTQPSDVGIITLSQVNATTVNILVDLKNSTYGFINTGGPHTPFAFNINGSLAGVTAVFSSPLSGTYPSGQFSLSTAGGSNTPYGSYNVAINSTAGNGSGNAFYGDLQFSVTRASGLLTTDFVPTVVSGVNYYFAADLTNGNNTGAQGWSVRTTTTTTPEPATFALLGTGIAGLLGIGARRRSQR